MATFFEQWVQRRMMLKVDTDAYSFVEGKRLDSDGNLTDDSSYTTATRYITFEPLGTTHSLAIYGGASVGTICFYNQDKSFRSKWDGYAGRARSGNQRGYYLRFSFATSELADSYIYDSKIGAYIYKGENVQ